MSGFSPWMIRRIQDCHLSFTKPGLKVYMRLKNVVDNDMDYVRLGFQWAPTGTQVVGYTDIQISPPPDVYAVSSRTIGVSGGRLQFGAHHFVISHTWVMQQMAQRGLSDARAVFREAAVVGLVYDKRLFDITELLPDSMSDQTIRWDITGNMIEDIISQ